MKRVFFYHRVTNEDGRVFSELLGAWQAWCLKNKREGTEWWLALSFGEEVPDAARAAMCNKADALQDAFAFPYIVTTDERALYAVFGEATKWLRDHLSRPDEIWFARVTAEELVATGTGEAQMNATYLSYAVVHERYQALRDSGGFTAAVASEAATMATPSVRPRAT